MHTLSPSYNAQSYRSRLLWGKEMTQNHEPVLTNEVIRYLEPGNAQIVVDATVGAGGHAEAILSEHHSLTLIGLDRDPTALELAARRLSCFGDRFRPVHDIFSNIASDKQDMLFMSYLYESIFFNIFCVFSGKIIVLLDINFFHVFFSYDS